MYLNDDKVRKTEERDWYKMLQSQGLSDRDIMFVIVMMSYPDSPASKLELGRVIESIQSIVNVSNYNRIQPILSKLTSRHERMR